jgi:hypothetical protein
MNRYDFLRDLPKNHLVIYAPYYVSLETGGEKIKKYKFFAKWPVGVIEREVSFTKVRILGRGRMRYRTGGPKGKTVEYSSEDGWIQVGTKWLNKKTNRPIVKHVKVETQK